MRAPARRTAPASRAGSRRWRRAAHGLGVLVLDAASAPSFLVPGGVRSFPHWLAGPFTGLGERTTWTGFGWLLVALFGAWLAVLAGVRSLSRARRHRRDRGGARAVPARAAAAVGRHLRLRRVRPAAGGAPPRPVRVRHRRGAERPDPHVPALARRELRLRPALHGAVRGARPARHRGRRVVVQGDRVRGEPGDGGDGLADRRTPRDRPALPRRARRAQSDRPRVRGRRRPQRRARRRDHGRRHRARWSAGGQRRAAARSSSAPR